MYRVHIRGHPRKSVIVDATTTQTQFSVAERAHRVAEAALANLGSSAPPTRRVVAFQQLGRAQRGTFLSLRVKAQEPFKVALKVLRRGRE